MFSFISGDERNSMFLVTKSNTNKQCGKQVIYEINLRDLKNKDLRKSKFM